MKDNNAHRSTAYKMTKSLLVLLFCKTESMYQEDILLRHTCAACLKYACSRRSSMENAYSRSPSFELFLATDSRKARRLGLCASCSAPLDAKSRSCSGFRHAVTEPRERRLPKKLVEWCMWGTRCPAPPSPPHRNVGRSARQAAGRSDRRVGTGEWGMGCRCNAVRRMRQCVEAKAGSRAMPRPSPTAAPLTCDANEASCAPRGLDRRSGPADPSGGRPTRGWSGKVVVRP